MDLTPAVIPAESQEMVSASPEMFTDFDFYLYGEGTHYRIYDKFGAHPMTRDGVMGVYFAVWAPHAQTVAVVGDFNEWQGDRHPMQPLKMGIWELFIPEAAIGDKYKFAVKNQQGHLCLKTDPYGYQQELRPDTASIITALDYDWQDADWLAERAATNPCAGSISVYEVHLGSWLHDSIDNPPPSGVAVPVPHKPGARFLTYQELGDRLIPYVKEMGYTHIELLPITEHPFDGSWGYQVVGYFAPTSRYGNPQDFMQFVDRCHQAGIGVIMDWVPGHFPKDAHGLAQFDGTKLYEYDDWRKGEHKGWGTLVFNYERNEVRNFLIASALFWFEKYHIDGIRVDAVASMLYLDYERKEWLRNRHGGRENLEAVDFLRQLNQAIFQYYPGVLSIAEESTTWHKVSFPVEEGGLGFNLKWNMGWMNDTLRYFLAQPHDRSNVHGKLTFSLWYAFSEHFMLALSHDEVVHGKGHLWQKMPGGDRQKIENLRALFGYVFTHPGKKTLFMGMELGQQREWSENRDLDWGLLQHEPHQQLHQLIKDLHQIYHAEKALYGDDFSHAGFEWIDCHDAGRSVISFIRKDPHSGEELTVICNFKTNVYHHYWLGVRQEGTYKLLLSTDDPKYGGYGHCPELIETRQWNHHPWPHALEITVPALSVMIFKHQKIEAEPEAEPDLVLDTATETNLELETTSETATETNLVEIETETNSDLALETDSEVLTEATEAVETDIEEASIEEVETEATPDLVMVSESDLEVDEVNLAVEANPDLSVTTELAEVEEITEVSPDLVEEEAEPQAALEADLVPETTSAVEIESTSQDVAPPSITPQSILDLYLSEPQTDGVESEDEPNEI